MNSSITIIIPTYNGAKKVVNCLHSLEKQTLKDFETIVVIQHMEVKCHKKLGASKRATRVKHLEVVRGEALGLQQRDCQAVAHRKLHRRRCGRGKAMRAGFLRTRQRKHHVGLLGES